MSTGQWTNRNTDGESNRVTQRAGGLLGWQLKKVLQITYHVWIDDFVYGSSRESFHKFVKCSVSNDCQNKCDESK